MKRIPINEVDGIAKTIVAGYYKFGAATLLAWGGSTGTAIMEIYDDRENKFLSRQDIAFTICSNAQGKAQLVIEIYEDNSIL